MEINKWTIEDAVVVALYVYMYCTNKSHGDDVSVMLFSWVNILFIGYFLFRILFQLGGRIAQDLTMLAVETIVCFESFLGLLQIIGVVRSNNYLFLCTGTFDNPGPLGGFLAVGICCSLTEIIAINQHKKAKPCSTLERLILGVSYVAVILCAIILPSTQSRAALLSIIGNIAISGWAIYELSYWREYYLTIDFDAWKQFSELYSVVKYTDSTFWFDMPMILFVVNMLCCGVMVFNLIWKIMLMRYENQVLNNSAKVEGAQ